MMESVDPDPLKDRLLEHAVADYMRRVDRGENVNRRQFLQEQPKCEEELRQFFEMIDQVEAMAGPPMQEAVAREPAAGPGGLSPPPVDWRNRELPFFFGRYNVLQRLGQGGMGTVFLAHDSRLDRKVALKIPLIDDSDQDSRWFRRFIEEARANIHHPNICTVYDTGIEGGQPFISMAYVQGPTLAALITPDRLLPELEAATMLRIVALAMEAVHQTGIVHRDLKPSNIMVNEQGQPIVMDFGLSRRLTADKLNFTSPGTIAGTLPYMSPEQLAGNEKDVTHSTDIYSLGVTFYELLTGKRPFSGAPAEVIRQIHEQRPIPPSKLRDSVEPALQAICLRMIGKHPSDRFPSMRAVAEAIDQWLDSTTARSGQEAELHLLRQEVAMMNKIQTAALGGLGLFGFAELASHFFAGRESSDDDQLGTIAHGPSEHPHDGWHSPLENLLHESNPIHRADPHFGTPQHDRAFWEGQQSYADTCAIRCQEYILQQFTGVDFPEKELVDEAKEHGWYRPGHGTSMQDVGNLLELHGVTVNRYTEANVFHLANELAQGHKVIIGVESSKLWGHNSMLDSMVDAIRGHFGLGGADHAVVVSGIDTTDPHHVKVIISDPGDGKAVASYPMEQFLHAWEGSQFYMVATQDPAPAHLPEMSGFDYSSGHVSTIANVPYGQFVEHFAQHHDAWEQVLDHFASVHYPHHDSAHHDSAHHDEYHAGNHGEHDEHHQEADHTDNLNHNLYDDGHHADDGVGHSGHDEIAPQHDAPQHDAPQHDDPQHDDPHHDDPHHDDHHSGHDDWP